MPPTQFGDIYQTNEKSPNRRSTTSRTFLTKHIRSISF